MARLPYDSENNPVSGFNYNEAVKGSDHDKYLWGNASFTFASNMVRAFQSDGWSVQIRGPQAGGKVDDLPVHLFDVGKGKQMKTRENILCNKAILSLMNLGYHG